jgi:hypothetical protein
MTDPSWTTPLHYMLQAEPFEAELMALHVQLRDLAFFDHMTSAYRVFVVVWGRDCDQCESTTCFSIAAHLAAYRELEESVYDDAEGPTSITLVSAREAAKFEPSFRDRRAEQYNY